MTVPVVGTDLRFALAFGAPPTAATGFAPASAHNHSFRGEKSQTPQKTKMSLENNLARRSRAHRRESSEVLVPSHEHPSFARKLFHRSPARISLDSTLHSRKVLTHADHLFTL
jgi:hypothetical protein